MNPSTSVAHHARRPWAVWLALWVLVLSALAPTVTHALDTLRDPSTADLCSATPSSTQDGAQAPATQAHGHCPLCVLSAERSVLPLTADLPRADATRGHEQALRSQWASVAATAVAGAPPRGPPAKP